jgi:membrane dipeptidase
MPVPFSVGGRADRQSAEKMEPVPLARLIDHFEHIIRVAGIDHVGLGSDFDGISSLPAGLESAADLPRITHALHERGYSREDLHKLLGGNLLRVFRTVQACASAPNNA